MRVSTDLTLSDLIIQLGAPASSGDRYGVTECMESGGGGWAKGKTWTVGGEESGKVRVGELGGEEEEEGRVVWLAAFDGEKHGV